MQHDTDQLDQSFEDAMRPTPPASNGRVLLVSEASEHATALRAALEVGGHSIAQGGTLRAAEVALGQESYDLVMVDADDPAADWRSVVSLARAVDDELPVILFCGGPCAATSIEAIRSGIADLLSMPSDLQVAAERASLAIAAASTRSAEAQRLGRIETTCRAINEDRHRVTQQVDALCNDLTDAYADIDRQMRCVATGAEFRTLVGLELDVESMLRTALEFMLHRFGPTNAVVYLRESASDWGVGAYVNYDRQGEDFMGLLELLGSAACSSMAAEKELVRFTDGDEFSAWAQLEGEALADCEVVSFSCHDASRCQAIVVLFRSSSRPFDDEMAESMDLLRAIFADQLGKILKIHSRGQSQPAADYDIDDDWSLGNAA